MTRSVCCIQPLMNNDGAYLGNPSSVIPAKAGIHVLVLTCLGNLPSVILAHAGIHALVLPCLNHPAEKIQKHSTRINTDKTRSIYEVESERIAVDTSFVLSIAHGDIPLY